MRRRVLELPADGEQTSGTVTDVIRAEFGISRHLRVLRDSGFASARAGVAHRFYAVEPAPLCEVDARLDRFRRFGNNASTPSAPSWPGSGVHAGPRSDGAPTPPGRVQHRSGQDRSTHREDMT